MADAALTLRAAAEVYVPSDLTLGAADIEADRFIAHYLDYVMPGLSAMIPALLDDAVKRHSDAPSFAEAELGARARTIASFDDHEEPMLRELPRLLGMLSLAAVYGAWSGQDSEGTVTREPLGWRLTGFDGPSRGR